MSSAAFVLMNLDLVAVPLQLDLGRVVTVYCGKRRATELRTKDENQPTDTHGGATRSRSDGGSKSNVDTWPPVAREIASQRSAGA